jgi:hypothetical protein
MAQLLKALLSQLVLVRLCLSGLLLVLDRGLLELFRGICCGILLLVELGLCVGGSVDGLVLLRGLAGGVRATMCALFLLSLKALDLLLCFGDVLYNVSSVLLYRCFIHIPPWSCGPDRPSRT